MLNVTIKIIVPSVRAHQELKGTHSYPASVAFVNITKTVPIMRPATDLIASVNQFANKIHAERMPSALEENINQFAIAYQDSQETRTLNVFNVIYHDLNVPQTLIVHHDLLVSMKNVKIHALDQMYALLNKLVLFWTRIH